MKPEANPPPGLDVNGHAIAGVAAVVFLLPLVAMLVVGWFYRTPAPIGAGEPPPGPQLQTGPARARLQRAQADRERLESYGWVDRQRGIVHVPIATAMAAEVAAARSAGRAAR